MKIRVNNKEVLVGGCLVQISNFFLTRQFEIWSTEKEASFNIGDEVKIFNDNDVLLIQAKIERKTVDKNFLHSYAGRNNAKYIVDCKAEKTTQFSEKVSVAGVLEEYAEKFKLKVKGSLKLPKTCQKTISIGDRLGVEFMRVVQSVGRDLTSDAVGNLEIKEKGEKKDDIVFNFGDNIRSREFRHDTSQEFDKYVIVAQGSNFTEEDLIIKGEYGSGEFVQVIRATDSLTAEECKGLAEAEYTKDRNKSFLYSVDVDADLKVEINGIYKVVDEDLGIKEDLKVRSITYIFERQGVYNMRVVFSK